MYAEKHEKEQSQIQLKNGGKISLNVIFLKCQHSSSFSLTSLDSLYTPDNSLPEVKIL